MEVQLKCDYYFMDVNDNEMCLLANSTIVVENGIYTISGDEYFVYREFIKNGSYKIHYIPVTDCFFDSDSVSNFDNSYGFKKGSIKERAKIFNNFKNKLNKKEDFMASINLNTNWYKIFAVNKEINEILIDGENYISQDNEEKVKKLFLNKLIREYKAIKSIDGIHLTVRMFSSFNKQIESEK